MKRVYKYAISPTAYPTVQLPLGAKILHFDFQAGEAFIWALVDPFLPHTEGRVFVVVGTGHDINTHNSDILKFIGTAMTGALVFHLFELQKERDEDWHPRDDESPGIN